MRSSIPLAKIAGIEVRVHFTLVFAFAVITWSVATSFLPLVFPGWSQRAYWGTGAAAAVLLFASVLMHELSHSLVARTRGFVVEGITLFIFGGVSRLAGEAKRPWDEFAIAVVGPLTSLVLAVAFGAAFWPLRAVDRPLTAVLGYLALVNGVLAAFNLLPGLPLDGGRVLRSMVWAVTRSPAWATRVSVWTGRLLGWGLVGWGVYMILHNEVLSGLWTIFIGWFMSNSAGAMLRETGLGELLRGAKVERVMDQDPPRAGAGDTLSQVFAEHFLRRGRRAVLVTDLDRLLGMLTEADMRRVPRPRWQEAVAGEAMTTAPVFTISADADLEQALQLMTEHHVDQLPVLADGHLLGLIDREQLTRYVEAATPARRGLMRRLQRRGRQGQET